MQRPLFRHAEVVAGQSGLQRRVRWVHILEIPHVDDTVIQGEELILSTGVGLYNGHISHAAFLQSLMEKKATCLCVELGDYFPSVSEELKALADTQHFPLIVFHIPVNFIEVTQDLHSLLINRHHQTLVKLDHISRSFHALSLTSRATTGIIQELRQHTGARVVFLPMQDAPVFFPRASAPEEARWLQSMHAQRALWTTNQAADGPCQWEEEGTAFLLHPIEALEQTFGFVGLMIDGRRADAFDSLILDRAAISLSHDFLRRHYVAEKKALSEAAWLEELIHGSLTDEADACRFLEPIIRRPAGRSFRIVLLDLDEAPSAAPLEPHAERETSRIHLALQVRFAFLAQLFHPLISVRSNQVVVLAIDLGEPAQSTARLKKTAAVLTEAARYEPYGFSRAQIGIGRTKTAYGQASDSFREAAQMVRIRQVAAHLVSPFYEEAGIYRLLLLIEKEAATASFIEDTLAPLINYDRAKGTELLKTLRVYLDEDCSTQHTAEKLFIVRQTLYHRLEKMKELLGDDFLRPDKRLALEVALTAYFLLARE